MRYKYIKIIIFDPVLYLRPNMRVFLLLAVAAVAVARPDVGLDYRYHVPATSYGVPSGSVGNLHDNRQYYHAQGQGTIINPVGPTVPATIFQAPIHEHSSFTGSSFGSANQGRFGGDSESFSGISDINAAFPGAIGHDSSSSNAQSLTGSSEFGSALNQGPTSSFSSATASASGSSSFGGASFDQSSQGGNDRYDLLGNTQQGGSSNSASHQSQQIEVQKHLYFYAAPEEQEEPAPRVHIPQPPPKKNVKIIFIKAPTYRAPTIQIAPQPQNEEKTLVYVLVKKPEEVGQFDIPTAAPTKPSKPEVYFIKYKTQKEAEEAIAKAQHGAAIGGTSFSANSVEGDQEFINTIGQDSSNLNHVGFSSVSDSRASFGPKQESDVSNGNSEESSKLSLGSGPSVESFPADSTSTVAPIADSKGPTYSPLFGNRPGYWATHPTTKAPESGIPSGSELSGSGGPEGFDSGSHQSVSQPGATGDNSFIFSGSTTPSSLDSLSLDSRFSNNADGHAVYGPPKYSGPY